MTAAYRLIRDVLRTECIWLCRDYKMDEVVYPHPHYVDPKLLNNPTECTTVAGIPNSATWFELPVDSLHPYKSCEERQR